MTLVFERPANGSPYQAFAALLGDKLEANARGIGEGDTGIVGGKGFFKQLFEAQVGLAAIVVFNANIEILGVFAEDDHVDIFGMFHGGRDTLEPAVGALADIKIQGLAQGDIQ